MNVAAVAPDDLAAAAIERDDRCAAFERVV
jgi:hypothetical protein